MCKFRRDIMTDTDDLDFDDTLYVSYNLATMKAIKTFI